jgi:hypothetical protein
VSKTIVKSALKESKKLGVSLAKARGSSIPGSLKLRKSFLKGGW